MDTAVSPDDDSPGQTQRQHRENGLLPERAVVGSQDVTNWNPPVRGSRVSTPWAL
ncbi:hypothetical protein [Natronococcus pandeyae]|uniref:hypothetical protein n=1 Tax=Natronococcus pandeyae TaxID=2055836 RepID=UPI001652C4EB|nr:hypothetical protein [Natronococcus pandeyae]